MCASPLESGWRARAARRSGSSLADVDPGTLAVVRAVAALVVLLALVVAGRALLARAGRLVQRAPWVRDLVLVACGLGTALLGAQFVNGYWVG